MATRIELPLDLVKSIAKTRTDALKRQINNSTNTLVKQALNDELAQITKGFDTATEIK